MYIYNSMSRKKEEFKPIHEGKVGIYACGPTVYNLIHIGNARPMIVFDTARRYMEYKGYDVNFHMLRHTFATKLIQKRVDIPLIGTVTVEFFLQSFRNRDRHSHPPLICIQYPIPAAFLQVPCKNLPFSPFRTGRISKPIQLRPQQHN